MATQEVCLDREQAESFLGGFTTTRSKMVMW